MRTRRESPLAHRDLAARSVEDPGSAGVVLGERPFCGMLNLRGDPRERKFLQAVRGALGVELPLEPNTVSEREETAVLWLGPDEWLVVTPEDREGPVAEALRAALRDLLCAVTDVGSGHTVITLRGPRAREVLAKGCSLDLHPREFGPGRCAQTRIARTGATLRQRDDSPAFDLIVRRSFADYLWAWLEDASLEYGAVVQVDSPGVRGPES